MKCSPCFGMYSLTKLSNWKRYCCIIEGTAISAINVSVLGMDDANGVVYDVYPPRVSIPCLLQIRAYLGIRKRLGSAASGLKLFAATNRIRNMASDSHTGAPFYGAGPYRSREGLSSRSAVGSDEIQLRIDPMHGELDDEITGLHKQIRMLKGVAQEIGTEAKFQNEFLNQLQSTLIKAQAGVKNNVRRLNRSINQHGTNHVVHVIAFALLLFAIIYLLSKISRR